MKMGKNRNQKKEKEIRGKRKITKQFQEKWNLLEPLLNKVYEIRGEK